jgi:hypothetical protein
MNKILPVDGTQELHFLSPVDIRLIVSMCCHITLYETLILCRCFFYHNIILMSLCKKVYIVVALSVNETTE